MRPQSPRRGKMLKDFKRSMILAAAKRVFTRSGLQGATMRSIAAEAGCTTGAVYPHFRGKRALYAQLLGDGLSALEREIAEAGSGESAALRLRAMIIALYRHYAENPDEFALGFYLSGGLARRGLGSLYDAKLNQQLAQALGRIGTALHECRRGDGREHVGQNSVFATVMGQVLLLHTGRLQSLREDAQSLLDQFLESVTGEALLAPPQTRPRPRRQPRA